MRLRQLPRTPESLREGPRPIPDEYVVRAFDSAVGRRFIVEARQQGRCLGDRTFTTHPDALAFAKIEAGWNGAKLRNEVDCARG